MEAYVYFCSARKPHGDGTPSYSSLDFTFLEYEYNPGGAFKKARSIAKDGLKEFPGDAIEIIAFNRV